MRRKSFVVAIIVLVFLGAVVLLWNRKTNNEKSESLTPSEIKDSIDSEQINSETNSWSVFRNEKYKYSVRFPGGILAENVSEDGYIIDFRFPIRTIRVYSSKNSRNDKTLRELVEVRNHVGVPIEGGDHEYLEKMINGKQAFQYRYSFLDEKEDRNPMNDQYYISVNTVILGKDYYYKIQTILPVNDEQYPKAEKTYDLFLNTFTLDPLQ